MISAGRICLPLAIFAAMAYMRVIRIVDLLVERAEPAPLPKTSLKSDLSSREGRAGLAAQMRILE
jgi:hypothetical protein